MKNIFVCEIVCLAVEIHAKLLEEENPLQNSSLKKFCNEKPHMSKAKTIIEGT